MNLIFVKFIPQKHRRWGGVGLFASFTLTIILFCLYFHLDLPDLNKLLSLLGSTMILLFLGMKDDLIAISPKKKLIGQIIASAIVVFSTDIRITSFGGLLGIGELNYMVSVIFTIFTFILVINSFNLTDGIDGLAGSIALVASGVFGVFFLLNENYLLVFVSFTLIGAIFGFLRYNLSDSRKLFMGDSGSLFLGFLLAYQGITFLTLNEANTSSFTVANGPILLLAILSFPLLDTLRVFTIRAKAKRNPFSPDRNHIHHRLLNLGLTHKRATSLIIIGNILLIELAYIISYTYINLQLFICITVGSMIYLCPFLRVFEKNTIMGPVKNGNDPKTNAEFEHPEQPVPVSQDYNYIDEEFFPLPTFVKTKQAEWSTATASKDIVDDKKTPEGKMSNQKQRLIEKRLSELKKANKSKKVNDK